MSNVHKSICLMLLLGICLFHAQTAMGDTLADIKYNVRANWSAVTDLTCTADISYADSATYLAFSESWGDWTDAVFKKSSSQVWLAIIGTSGDSRYITNDGTDFAWKGLEGIKYTKPSSEVADHADGPHACDALMNIVALIDDNTWSLDEGTYSVSGIQCYRISCQDYYMYVDTATSTKVMKVEDRQDAYNCLLLSSYTYVESTSYLPQTVTHYWHSSTSMTTDSSNININESLTSSDFAAPQ